MNTKSRPQARSTTLYSQEEHARLSRQLTRNWIILGVPCLLLLAALIYTVSQRNEAPTIILTIVLGMILILGYDFLIKPARCYLTHVNNALYGRVRETHLPFHAISEDVSMVDGVAYRAMTCMDVDGKGRPYERLFYFDNQKTFPDFQEGEMLCIMHHDLEVADVVRA